ncbi:MAG TPA: hypothetical protein VNK81_02715 [Thermodesulfobacteriota bacterium]|jgi:hypothetical protein|nr:hypothetical protein [Thermodesulfobacteriota bacterium]
MITKGIFAILTLLLTLPPGVEVSVLSKGFTGDFSFPESLVIRDKDGLKKTWDGFGIGGDPPSVDFESDLVVVLVSRGKLSGSLEISGVEKMADDTVRVRFVVRPLLDLRRQKPRMFPYIIARLHPLDSKRVRVSFFEDIPLPPVPKDTAIGQSPPYTNVLKGYGGVIASEFLPLDRGNSWTYRVESKGEEREETYSVISISQDGWSVFDGFFGKKGIAMRVDSSGDIFISSEKGVRAFYTEDTKRDFSKSVLSTPAGRFNDLMIVTLPENDTFWFRDVYARGVGLIYHEQRSPKGDVKYTLIRAKVRGKNYPLSASQ